MSSRFPPLGKGNLSVGEEEIKVTKKRPEQDKVSGVEGAGGRKVGSRVVAEGACNRTGGATRPPPLHLASLCLPPRAKR